MKNININITEVIIIYGYNLSNIVVIDGSTI